MSQSKRRYFSRLARLVSPDDTARASLSSAASLLRHATYTVLTAGLLALVPFGGAHAQLVAPDLPPNPGMEENVDLIREGAAFMMDDEEAVNLMQQYVLKRYVQDNCNAFCTVPCRNLGGWLWQNPDVTCK